jgi:hypothetical protein
VREGRLIPEPRGSLPQVSVRDQGQHQGLRAPLRLEASAATSQVNLAVQRYGDDTQPHKRTPPVKQRLAALP